MASLFFLLNAFGSHDGIISKWEAKASKSQESLLSNSLRILSRIEGSVLKGVPQDLIAYSFCLSTNKAKSSLSRFHRARQYKLDQIMSLKFWHSAFLSILPYKSENQSVGRFPSFFRLDSLLNKTDPLWNHITVPTEHAWVGTADEGDHSRQSLSWLEHLGQVHVANNPLKPHKW